MLDLVVGYYGSMVELVLVLIDVDLIVWKNVCLCEIVLIDEMIPNVVKFGIHL